MSSSRACLPVSTAVCRDMSDGLLRNVLWNVQSQPVSAQKARSVSGRVSARRPTRLGVAVPSTGNWLCLLLVAFSFLPA